jgi:serine/threonine protein kinase
MNRPFQCPDELTWQTFVSGKLSDLSWVSLHEHSKECPHCQAVIQRISQTPATTPDGAATPPHDSANPMTDLTHTKLFQKTEVGEHDAKPFDPDELFDDSLLGASEHPGSLGKLGKYEVEQVIGSGAFGVVLKAYDLQLRRFVAIKILNRQFSSSATARRRFIREARAAAAVSHNNVVAIHAVEEQSGIPFLVMELVAGPSLRDRIAELSKLPPMEVIRLGAQIAGGLAAAHAQGVVHRDIKPGNIMLEKSLDRVKITDFGLARVAIDNVELTSHGMAVGTPAYMAPEQVTGDIVDARSDLFALGCVLHAALVGHSPFHGRTALEVARRITELVPVPLSKLDPLIPQFLSDLVTKLLQKNPDKRFQSAAEVADLLNRYLVALNQSPSDKFQSVLQNPLLLKGEQQPTKQQRFVSTIVAMLAFIAGAIGVGMWMSNRNQPVKNDSPQRTDMTRPEAESEPLTVAADPQVLTVSQSGDAAFRTLNEAFAKVTPRTTIRVLDDATYRESLKITDPRRFNGLKLIAEKHARLAPPDTGTSTPRLVEISRVDEVVLKGWKIDAPRNGHAIYLVEAGSVSLEDLEIEQPPDVGAFAAIQVHAMRSQAGGPIEITNCHIKTTGDAQCVWIQGTAQSPRAIRLARNRFERRLGTGSNVAVWMEGDATLTKLTVRENLFTGGDSAISLVLRSRLPAHSVEILNNTFFHSRYWLGFETSQPSEPVARIANNLILGGERVFSPNLEEALRHWEFRSNWWERGSVTDVDHGFAGRIAESKAEGSLRFLSRDPNAKEFLRPASDADWLEAGSGGAEPKYLGAFGPVPVAPP